MGVTTINDDKKNTPRIQKSLMIVLLVPRNQKKKQVGMYMVDVSCQNPHT